MGKSFDRLGFLEGSFGALRMKVAAPRSAIAGSENFNAKRFIFGKVAKVSPACLRGGGSGNFHLRRRWVGW